MKKCKRILAGILAFNLALAGVMPVDAASVETQRQNENNYDYDIEEYTEDTTVPSEKETSTSTEKQGETESISESTQQKTDDEISDDTQQESTENVIDNTQQESDAIEEQTEETEEISTQSVGSTLDLNQLSGYNQDTKTMTVDSNEDLILLSNCNQKDVADITIYFVSVGEIDVTKPISSGTNITDYFKSSEPQITADGDYIYQGIGSEEYPFCGEITGTIPATFKINNSFFGGLSSKATLKANNNKITWCGTGAVPMVAKVYQFDSKNENSQHTLPITMQGDTSAMMGSLIGTVKSSKDEYKTQTLVIESGTVTYGTNVAAISATENSGLICNTLESGNICLDNYSFPTNSYTVNSTASYDLKNASAAGNAGGVIGVMKSGTKLQIKTAVNVNQVTISSDNGNAGGLVGLLESGAKITTEENANVTISTSTSGNNGFGITGAVSAGGVVGAATDELFDADDLKATITVDSPIIKSQSKANATIGGFIGNYTLNAVSLSSPKDFKLSDKIVINNPTLTVTNNGLAGGYFGQLNLKGQMIYTIGSDGNKKEINPSYKDCSAEAVGAIAGKVISDTIGSTLLIQNVQVIVTNSSGNGIQRHGGLIGEVGTKSDANAKAYLKVSNVDVNVTNPSATDEKDKGYGFGGVAGLLAQGSILQIENTVAISTENDTAINRGGGLVGYAEKSIINLSGTTDLSGTLYVKDSGKNSNDPKTGWLVGCQDSALIYANGDGNGNGWSYIRGKESGVTKQAMNDIGNYGQIIRLYSNGNSENERSKLSSDLITIDATSHEISYKQNTAPTINGNTITLGSTDAFARLSIAWNTRGYFGDVAGIQQDVKPQSKDITLTSDVDLTGSGITGLSRDTYSTDDTYAGTFDGGGHTIILASGETFGFKQDNNKEVLAQAGDDGYGEVISAGASYHGRQGIFAKMSTATIQNLTVDGNIWISNNGSNDILVGGIAAELTGTNSKINISGVTIEEEITADGAGGSGLMLGGFFGGSYDSGIEINLNDSNTSNTAAAVISINECPNEGTNDRRIIAGGVIGELGEQTFSINVKCLTVKGSIKTDAKKSAYIGGLIGAIKGEYGNTNHYIKISNAVFNDFTIDAKNATDMCGGLFGSIWASVEVVLQTPTDTDKYAVDVQNATINATNAASVGGFAYRAGGKWEIQDRGINLNTFLIKAKKDVGLLVCRGEQAKEQLSGGEKQIAALYLSTTKYWENAYRISKNTVSVDITGANSVFDEFVAYTTSASWNSTVRANVSDILKNNKNGIISIATQDVRENEKITRIGVDPSNECTTYQNRTTYGKNKHNKWSRYYYDLDQCLKDIKDDSVYGNNKNLDTPQELLVWSVYTYADDTLKKYFSFSGCGENQIKIGGDSTRADLNMKKYSYYPVTYTGGSVNILKADIKFYNQEIENIETESSDKKSTQGQTAGDYTQHYTMHCGLFLTYQSVNSSRAGAPLYVNDVTLSGSIGKVNKETSGALVADFAGGYDNMYSAISINNTILDNLKVNGCSKEYAPLLVNRISLNLNLTVNTISTKNYENGTPVASSLIGIVGSTSAENITMNFQNIKLPDKKADGTADSGIFSHATLLESYTYKKDSSTSNATYIFYYKDDWSEGKPHHDNVTYGKEITNSTEFAGIQKWYYDEKLHGTDDGLVYDSEDNKSGFDASGYLPYVYVSYSEANCTHEIKVNQRVENILEGCGTYGHPYRITKAAEMNILSEYLSTGLPQKDWRVRVTKNQAMVHTSKSDADYSSDEDVVYQYDGNGNWVQVENTATDGTENWQSVNGGKNTLGKDFMLNYLLNAYYDIQGSVIQGSGSTEKQLILNDFKGLGSESNPFRGVITSSNNTTLVLKGDRTGNGLIPYSYGSVVKNLKISYQKSDENQGKTLTYETNTTSITYPKVAFGGVIGCVMGGDNIIDGVTVELVDAYLTLSGQKSYLLQVGGYVGSVSGGGVIFRNMIDNTGLTNGKVAGLSASISENNKFFNLYVNPYVGRVMDGFVFYEKTSDTQGVLSALENTNKNYKINTLNAGTHLDVNNNTITVKDAEGLLILSAIVNSGAASGGNSLAYSRFGDSQNTVVSSQDTGRNVTYTFGGKYGKVRNAAYSAIGTNSTDATDSIAEDQKLPGESNLPYLIQKYGNKQTAIFSATTDSMITLSDDSVLTGFDMTNYENGYQGIGARYVSNAVRGYSTSSPTPVNIPENLVPEVKIFNGNNKVVTVDMQVSEYTDDDYPTASVGGIFNVVRVSGGGTLSSVVIKQKTNSTSALTDTLSSDATKMTAGISLTYYNSNGSKADTACNNNKEVGLGGFAGSLVGYTDNNANRDITIASIQVNGLTIDSPASAGGIFGNVGKPAAHKNSNIAILLQPKDSQMTYGVAFNNCSYQELNVTGKYAAGGFAGYIGNTDQNPKSAVNENGDTQTEGNVVANTMKDSTITATDNSSWAGGLFGYVKTRMFINMTDGGDKKNSTIMLQNVAVRAGTAVGGCIGYIDTKRYGIHNVTVKGINDLKANISLNSNTTGTFYAGGIVGYAKGGWNDWHPDNWDYVGYIGGSSIENVQINTPDMAGKHDYIDTYEIKTNYITGGIVGQTAGGKTRMESCTVTTSDVYGSVASGITGQTDSQMEFIGCIINGSSEDLQTNIKGFSTAGGILGFWTGGQSVTIQKCKIQYLKAEGNDWGSGAIIGDAKGGGAGILYLFDTSAQDCTVTAAGNKDNGGGRWPCVGSIIGNLRNSIKASNVLISNVTLTANSGSKSNETHGLLFGNFNNNVINIAGISIQRIPDSNMEWSLTGGGTINASTSYIAFADYSGTSLKVSSDSQPANASPYVVTSPKSTLKLYENTTTNPQDLYGDGVVWRSLTTGSGDSATTTFITKAQEIYNNRSSVTDGHYAYKNIGGTDFTFAFDSAISTYNANQTVSAEINFPVLQIGSGSADTVQNYLDIVTNGAFSAANNLNKQNDIHVTARSDVYEYKDDKFVKVANADTTSSAFNVNTDNTGKISFSTTTDYDNGKGRFNLLTVTFTEKDADNKTYNYNVFVPVLVRRMLQVDFTATLSYGTNFISKNYESLKSHVLESFGSSITAYLTYTYNSENGTFTDYGWQSYINAGGNVAVPMQRTLEFSMGNAKFPTGTQLSLIDCKDDRVYYYTVGSDPISSIPLDAFMDSDGNVYKAPSIAELMKTTVSQDNAGIFVKVDENGKIEGAEDEKDYPVPTVRIWNDGTKEYEYYRRAESGEKGKYTITVDENSLKDADNHSTVSESYYLVITVPKDSDSQPLNGSLQTSIGNTEIPNNINYTLIQGGMDDHNNKASTYLISSGYQQKLEEKKESLESPYKKMSETENVMKVNVIDQITFPYDQAYLDGDDENDNTKDELYLRFVGSLQKNIDGNLSAEQFPNGTTGTANFYVYREDDAGVKYYYSYNSKTQTWNDSGTTETLATSYQWTSDGGNMELPLAAGTSDNLISLQGVRKFVKAASVGKTEGTFFVEVKMDVTIPPAGLSVIPESAETNGVPNDYVKFVYASQLSTEKTSIAYSSNRDSVSNTYVSYYQSEPAGAKLTYDADQIDQLGINLLDLKYLDAEKKNVFIDTTATYDLSSIKNMENTLKKSSGIKFTLKLLQKDTAEGNQENYQSAIKNANDYLSVELKSQDSGQISYDSGTWSWTVPKDTYWKDDNINTASVFDGSVLMQAIQLKVNIDNVETAQHYYSNYQVFLTAEVLEDNNTSVGKADDNIIYTLAKIKLEFQQ